MASDDEEMDVNEGEDDDDDTSSDTSEEEIDDSKQEAELTALRDIVQSNPYNYQAHIDYITLARQYTNLDHLRFARQTMSEFYPLTPQLWLDWIRDEKLLLIANTEENKDFIQLFERAINDYLSVMIWIEYVQYRIPYYTSLQSIEQLRNFFERGLSSCGIHLTDGSLLWAAYIETEKAILDGIRLNYNTNKNLKEKLVQHVEFILTLYRRQLSIPLREMKNIYSKDYQEFCEEYKEYLPSNYHEQYDLILKRDYEHALEQLEQCEKFENELDQTNRSVLTYRKYIQFEKEPTRIQCLYERAIGKNISIDQSKHFFSF
jgi:regulator of sigma D